MSKVTVSSITLLPENDTVLGPTTLRSMANRPQRPARGDKRETPTLFVGEWIRALGKRPRDVVDGTTVNEGYLSQLINRRKTNPTQAYLQEIADFLGIPVQCFYRLPPSKDALGELAGLDPLTLSRLGSASPPRNKAK